MSLVHPPRLTIATSAATEGSASWSFPGNKLFQRGYVSLGPLPHLCWQKHVEKKLICHIPEFGNPTVSQVDYFVDDVYQHTAILSLAGWLEFQFILDDDIPRPYRIGDDHGVSAGEGLILQ